MQPSFDHRKQILLSMTTASIFEVGQKLGSGGFAGVFLAQQWNESFQGTRTVALKLLFPGSSDAVRHRFQNEGQLLPTLQHRNIVRHIENGKGQIQGGDLILDYLALGYVAGETLQELIDRTAGPLPLLEVLGIAEQISEALTYLHQRHIYHCDLKPSNILLDYTNSQVVINDFGTVDTPDFSDRLRLGTREYAAPEQANGGNRDQRTDIYALGVILCEMVTGRHLFPDRLTAEITQGTRVTLDSSVAATLDFALAQVISRCLRRDPGERYQTATALFEDLREAVQKVVRRGLVDRL